MRIQTLLGVCLCACATATPGLPPPPPAAAKAELPPPVAPTLRTDGRARPTRAALELTVVPESDRLAGKVAFDLLVNAPTDVVWLNATGLTIASATLGGAPARVVAGNEDFVGFLAEAPLPVGPSRLEVAFSGPIDHARSQGVYAEQEGADAYAYTFFEPIDARRAFPCFDEPAAKIPWTLTLHVKQGHVARANTRVLAEREEPEGLKRVEFEESRPLPSYLVAFVVGPFEVVDDGVAGRAKTPVQFIIPKGRGAELGWAREITPKVVAALEDYFDMDYPFGKLDVAVVPRYWGTMEHPGLVAMGQPLTLIRPEEATRPRKQHYTSILAHELAHYWFGDLVTHAWWDDTWLNEALGSWMDLIITDAVAPQWRVREERVDIAARAMNVDELLSTQPIRLPVTTRQAIGSSFDANITYSKGASVLRMFEASVTPAKWRGFIQGYLRKHAGQNATAEQFLGEATEVLGADAGAGLRAFVTQPGVPRIEGVASCTGDQRGLTLRQHRALAAGLTEPSSSLWPVPVCLRAGAAAQTQRTCVTLSTAEAFVPLPFCPEWVVLNDEATGYYRSAVDVARARALFTPSSPLARRVKLSVAERKLLVADLRAAVTRGEVKLDEVLALAPLLQRDEDDRIATEGLVVTAVRTDALDEALYARYRAFRKALCAPLAGKLGWARGPSDSDERQQLRGTALGCAARAGDQETVKRANALLDGWLASKEKSGLSDELVGTALFAAAHGGAAARFEQLLAATRAATDRNARARLMAALGGFTDPALSARALALVSGTELDLRESSRIVMIQLGQRETREATWTWLGAHLDELLARMRSDEASWFLAAIAEAFCDPRHRAEAQALVEPRAARVDGAQIAVGRGLEASSRCIEEQTRVLPALQRFLATVKQ